MKNKYFYSFLFVNFLIVGVLKQAQASLFSFKVDSVQILFDRNQLILPGESFKIGVESYHKNGKVKKTMGVDGGSVLWMRYEVEVAGGTARGGKITVSPQLMPSKGKYIELKVYPKKQPELAKHLLIPLNYETNITFEPENNFDKAPGAMIDGVLVSTFDNGMSRVLKKLNRNNESEHFRFFGNGGYWERGKFYIDEDFLNIENHQASVIVQSLRNYSVADTFTVFLDYRHSYRLNFRGGSGMSGFSGTSGMSGSTGYNGGNGEPGQYGEPGYDAPDLGVWSDLYYDSVLNCNLLYVFAQNFNTGEEFRYLVNPDGGSFSISTIGGSGGNGGNGGRGGDGGRGADGSIWYEQKVVEKVEKKPRIRNVEKKVIKKVTDAEGKETEVEETVLEQETYYVDEVVRETISVKHQEPGEQGGDGGDGGNGGLGGPGGRGGDVYLYFTEDSRGYERLFNVQTDGGTGGLNGSGGAGGNGGSGGNGEPNGSSGYQGYSGFSPMGWASDGWDGDVYIGATEEFYVPHPVDDHILGEISEDIF